MANKPKFPEMERRFFLAVKRYELTERKDLNRAELGRVVAKAVGWWKDYSDSTVSQWLAGNQVPTIPQMAALADYLNAHPGWMAFGEAGMCPEGCDSKTSGGEAEPPAAPLRVAPKTRRPSPPGRK